MFEFLRKLVSVTSAIKHMLDIFNQNTTKSSNFLHNAIEAMQIGTLKLTKNTIFRKYCLIQSVIFGGHFDSWDVGTGSMDDGSGVIIAWQVRYSLCTVLYIY
jgi:hypothetical protein